MTARITITMILVIALLLSGCSTTEPATTDSASTDDNVAQAPEVDPAGGLTGDPVRIGLIAQDEELIAYPEMAEGARAAQAYVNAELDGVDGAPLEVEVCNVGDTPESTVSCAQQFANDDSIGLVLMGTLNSPAGNEILSGVGKPVLSLQNDIPDIITDGVWSFDTGAITLAAGLLKFAADDLQADTYALLIPDDPFYTEVVVGLVEALGSLYGIAPQDNPVTVPLEGDPTGPVTSAAAQGADVLIAVANDTACIPIANAVASVGVDIPVIAADTCMTTDVISSGALDGWYGVSVCEAPIAPDGRSDDTFTEIVDTYGDGDPILNSSFGCWAVGNVIIAAEVLGSAGGAAATPETIAEAMDGYANDSLPAYPPVSCPGPDPFLGACLRTTTTLRITGDQAALENFVDVDVAEFSFLLEG